MMLWAKMSQLPMGPIAHGAHCPCDLLPMWAIPLVPHTSCAPIAHVPHIPLYPIPRVGLIAHMPHIPCTPLPLCPYGLCTPYPRTTLSLWASLAMCSIPLYPIAPCVHIAHRPHCPCGPYPLYPITHMAHYPMGTAVMGHMGNGAHGAIVYRGYWVQGV